VWLYGGGGTMGSGHVATYHGDAFARDGVVLVTINYRLGALAGFAHPSLTRSVQAGEGFANYHLLDAIAALQWVKTNAAAFGGDASNVTLFGESAGATMVANLLTSPQAKGLFQKAIVESTGSLPTPATPLAKAEEAGAALATAHGLQGNDATLLQLRAIPAQAIIGDAKTGRGLRTILDGRVKTQSIMDSFAAGTAIDVPMIIGTNSDEGRLSGTQKVATYAMSGAPVWQYFFDYVPDWRRPDQPNGAPHAAEIPYAFDTLAKDRTGGSRMTPKDFAVGTYIHSCWVAFAKASPSTKTLSCANGFEWPARTAANGQAVAIFQDRPSLGKAPQLRSPPNGAKPGPTSRDEE
jgi:para-nitrobenzyl esterase